MRRSFDHLGIRTTEPRAGKFWVPQSRVWVTNPWRTQRKGESRDRNTNIYWSALIHWLCGSPLRSRRARVTLLAGTLVAASAFSPARPLVLRPPDLIIYLSVALGPNSPLCDNRRRSWRL